jgi:hypothetical protein
MPSDAELRTLLKIVLAKYPRLDPARDRGLDPDPDRVLEREARFTREFRRAFFALGFLGRLPGIETKNTKALSWWSDYCGDVLRGQHQDDDVNGRTLALAVLAHGDIPHTIGDRFPFDVILGLTYPSAGVPAGDAWRRVLTTANLRPASALPPNYDREDGGPRARVFAIDTASVPIGRISGMDYE